MVEPAKSQNRNVPAQDELLLAPPVEQVPLISVRFNNRVDGFSNTTESIIRGELQRHRLYGQEFLYSAFHPDLLESVRKFGTYRFNDVGQEEEVVFCCFVGKDESGDEAIIQPSPPQTLSDYLSEYTDGLGRTAFAIYRRDCLQKTVQVDNFKFPLGKQKVESLAAIMVIEDFGEAGE